MYGIFKGKCLARGNSSIGDYELNRGNDVVIDEI